MKTVTNSDDFEYPDNKFLFSKETGVTLPASIEKQFEIIEQHRSFRKRQIHKKCLEFSYKNHPEDKFWKNNKTELKHLIELSINSPDEAKATLRGWAGLNNPYKGNYAYNILFDLKQSPYIYTMSDKERVSIFQVLIDTIDDMIVLKGGSPDTGFRITDAGHWVTKPLLQNLPMKTRIDQIAYALQHGKATSWLISLMRLIMHEHLEVQRSDALEDFWLIKDELEIIKNVTFDSILVKIDTNFYKMVDPKQMFLFWREVGTREQNLDLDGWIKHHVEDDEKFLAFISIFSGSIFFQNKIIWRVLTGTLRDFLDISQVCNRLDRIIKNDKSHLERAAKLLDGINIARSLKSKYDHFFDRVTF